MQITVDTRAPALRAAEVLALPLCAREPESRLSGPSAALDKALGGRLSGALATGDFRGQRGETLLLYGEGSLAAERVLLVGLGDEKKLTGDGVRLAAGVAAQAASRRGCRSLALVLPTTRRVKAHEAAQAATEGVVLASYRFDRYHTTPPEKGVPKPPGLSRVTLLTGRAGEVRGLRGAVATGRHLAESQNLARDLSNEPPNVLPPAALAREARRMAQEVGLRVRVLGDAELKKERLGALLAVASGSHNRPRLIVVEHAPKSAARGRGAAAKSRRICLVGKGVTFDSGGLSLKPSTSMVTMKHDMSGAAAVLGALRAIALLKLPLRVAAVIGAVENMPSGTAYRPDDILTSGSGKTIEVLNTDAEGRLVLADALHYARRHFAPEAIVDVATLTGACAVALGPWAAAVVSNHDRLSERIVHAGETTGERFWPLPLWDVHRDHMRSHIADVKQTGGRHAGTTTAAAFLSHFVEETPWAHLDIASTANTDQPNALQPRGATGFGVRALVETLRGLAAKPL